MQFMVMGLRLILWMLIIPFCCGIPFSRQLGKWGRTIEATYLLGILFMISVFQICYLGFVMFFNYFTPLVWVVAIFYICFSLISIGLWWKQQKTQSKDVKAGIEPKKISEIILWAICFVLVGLQLYKTVVYAYPDGDDAFYSVLSVITEESDKMYLHVPYTGETSVLDKRHAFSSAPIFMAFLGRVCQIHPVIIANVFFSVIVIILVYCVYKMIASILLEEEKEWIPLFLIVINLIYLFGNSTIYQDTTFLLTRTGQGKAFLANVIPATMLLSLLLVNQQMKQREVDSSGPWILMGMTMLAAGYTSTMGMFLAPFILGIGMLLLSARYKEVKLLLKYFLAFLPLGSTGLLYLLLVYLKN